MAILYVQPRRLNHAINRDQLCNLTIVFGQVVFCDLVTDFVTKQTFVAAGL